MLKRTPIRSTLLVALLLTALAGCGGDDDGDENAAPTAGTFVGEVSGRDALVAVVTAPVAEGEDGGKVTVYVSDAEGIDELLSGSTTGNEFEAVSEDDDAEAKGKVSGVAVTGTLELPGEETVRYTARRATATSGLYDLTVTSKGELRGASAAGVALKGETPLPDTGAGTLKLADGTKLDFEVTANDSGDPVELRPGQVRLIVLPSGELRGGGQNKADAGEDDPGFFVRSAAGK